MSFVFTACFDFVSRCFVCIFRFLLTFIFFILKADIFTMGDGRPKGSALVVYQHPKEAARSIRELHESQLDGRNIFVREWRQDDGGGDRNHTSGGSNSGADGRQLYVGNISYETTWQDLKDYFRQCGNVENADVIEDSHGKKKGFGIVRFSNERDANNAIRRLDGVEWLGRRLAVRFDKRDNDGAGPANDRRGGQAESHSRGDGDSCKLYVGNISYETSWQDLKDYFRPCGDVENAEIIEGSDGKKKGFGIVTFSNERDANNAIRRLDGVDFLGRRLSVRFDKRDNDGGGPSSVRRVGQSDSHSHGGGGGGGSCKLYVGNISYETSWQDLKDYFRSCGDVENAEVIEGLDGRKKGFAIVTFTNERDANNAIRRLDGGDFQGRTLAVRFDKREGGGGGPTSSGRSTHDDRGGSRRGGGEPEPRSHSDGSGCKLYVGNISYETSWQDLKDYFRPCGDVANAEVIEGVDGRKKGFAIVTFTNEQDANNAIRRLDGIDFQGRKLAVRFDKREGGGGSASRPQISQDEDPEMEVDREEALGTALSASR
jgi:RNA recognition motif-containing protein